MAGNWLGGDDPNTLGGGINIIKEVTERTGSFGTGIQALDAARTGNTRGLQETGRGTFAADHAAADVVKEGLFKLGDFKTIFGGD